VFAIKQLILTTGYTAQLINHRAWLNHFTQSTGNRYGIIGMRLGKAENLGNGLSRTESGQSACKNEFLQASPSNGEVIDYEASMV
jgi:hypothetical protein